LRDVVAKEPAAWVEFLGSMAAGLPPDMKSRVLRNDRRALAASVEDDRPDISDQVASAAVPMLFFVGDRDPRHERCKEFGRSLRARSSCLLEQHAHCGEGGASGCRCTVAWMVCR
jgi:hypothetical protein